VRGVDRRKIKSFRPLKRSGHFSLRCPLRRRSGANGEAGPKGAGQDARSQEKVTKRKDTPALRFQHIPVLKVRAWRRVVSTAHPCADETMADLLSATLRADPPPSAASQGPLEERALQRARTTSPAPSPAERSESSARERMDALPAKGPLPSGGRWRSTRRAVCRMHAVFRRCMDAPPKNSAAARGPGGHDARKALRRAPSLW
jgi:hypothetical protein